MILERVLNTKVLLIFLFAMPIAFAQKYPDQVRKNLIEAKGNASELIKVLTYYRNESEKLKAAYFLIENMDCHASQGYRWLDEKGEPFRYNEFDYKNYNEAVMAFNLLSSQTKLTPQTYLRSDLTTISAQ